MRRSPLRRPEGDECHAPTTPRLVSSAYGSDVLATGEERSHPSRLTAGPFAVHHLDVQNARRPALDEVCVQQLGNVRWPEEV
jgi:hypothetical protein